MKKSLLITFSNTELKFVKTQSIKKRKKIKKPKTYTSNVKKTYSDIYEKKREFKVKLLCSLYSFE